jgi:hypothetical protein
MTCQRPIATCTVTRQSTPLLQVYFFSYILPYPCTVLIDEAVLGRSLTYKTGADPGIFSGEEIQLCQKISTLDLFLSTTHNEIKKKDCLPRFSKS